MDIEIRPIKYQQDKNEQTHKKKPKKQKKQKGKQKEVSIFVVINLKCLFECGSVRLNSTTVILFH